MTKIRIAFFWAFLLATCTFAQNADETFDIQIGINLSEWLEKNEDLDKKDSSVTTADLDSIKKYGFDHVRIPVNEEIIFDDSLNVRPKYFKLLKNRIDYCRKIGLKVIVDLHASRLFAFTRKSNALFKEPQPIDAFLNVWKKLQNILRDYPTDFLAYECLNEPAAPIGQYHLWNNVLARWVPFIRQTEKDRFLFVGTDRGNQLWTLKYLKIPQDSRLVLTIHYYNPFLFTHFAYSEFRIRNYSGTVHYPGTIMNDYDYGNLPDSIKKDFASYREYYDKKKIYEDLYAAIEFSKKHKIPLNIGEFGCRRYSAPDDRLQWFKDVTSILKENGASYTLWGLNGAGFGIWINGELDRPMIEAIK